MWKILLSLVCILMIALVAITGCDDDDDNDTVDVGSEVGETAESTVSETEESTADETASEEQLCESLDALEESLKGLTDIDSDNLLDDLKTAFADVSDAYFDVQAAAQNLDNENLDAIDAAFTELEQAVKDLPDQSSITDAVSSIGEPLSDLNVSWRALQMDLNCDE